MINKITASSKLYMLVFIMSFFIIAIGVYGIIEMKTMNQNTGTLYADRVFPLQQLTTIRFAYAAKIISAVEQVQTSKLGFKEATKKILEAEKNIHENWKAYLLTYLTPEEDRLAKQTSVLMNQSIQSIEKLKAVLNKEDISGLNKIINQELYPAFNPVIEKLSELIELQVTVGAAVYKDSNKVYHSSLKRLILLIALSLILAIPLCYYLIRNIKDLIRDLKESNETIKKSEEKLWAFIKYAGDAIFIMNESLFIVDINESAGKLLGYSREELLRMRIPDIMTAAEQKSFPLRLDVIKKEGASLQERKLKKKDGTYVDIEVNIKLLENIGYISIMRDVTERKITELALKESEEKYRYLFQNNPAFIIIWDPQTLRILEVNNTVLDTYGYNKEEWEEMTILDYRSKEDHEKIKAFAKSMIESNEVITRRTWPHLKKNGEEMLMEVESHKIMYNKRNAILSLAIDVTEQMNTQTALRKSEDCFRSLVDNAADAIFMVDDSGIIFDVNLSASQLLNYTKKELIGMSVLNLYPTHIREGVPELWDILRKNKSFTNETKLLRNNGSSVEVEISRTMLPDASGAIAIVRDITERKVVEEKIKNSEARLKEAQAIALLGSWEIDLVNNIHIWSDEFYKIFGVKKGEIEPSTEALLSFMYPDDVVKAQEEINEAFQTYKESTTDFRFLGKEGTKRYAYIEWRFEFDKNKNPIRLYGTLQDITERKIAERNIKQSEANYRQLFDLSPASMWVIDEQNYTFLQVNKACINNYGYSKEEFANMSIKDISPGYNEINNENGSTKKSMLNSIFIGEQKHIKKSGEIMDVVTSSMSIVLNGEKKTLMIALDVTEKNLYEQKLTRAAIKAQEDERYEIGGELHDNVCQILATSLIYLGFIKKKFSQEAADLFGETQGSITLALNEIRNLSHRLAPAFFDNTSLDDAFKHLLNSFNIEKKYEISLHFDTVAKSYPISRELQLNLYRILQEQLRNILKHAKASRIEVIVTIKNNILQMRIADNGIGIDTKTIKEGIGLANMNRRAQLFSGKFTLVDPVEEKGCEVLVEIPLSNNN